MSPGLFDHAVSGVDQHDGDISHRGARHHIAGVLRVARSVGNDEASLGRCKVAVGHIDGDALLALGPQSVGE